MGKLLLLIGTYTSGSAEGIYLSDFDPDAGSLSPPRCAARAEEPSFLAVHPRRPLLFAVNETADPGGRSGGSVSAFSLDGSGGRLTFINRRPSGGGSPCHVSCHPGGKWIAAANYARGTVAVFPVLADGSLGEASCVVAHAVVTHAGAGRDPVRQDGPHAHAIVFDPGGRFAFAPDLGIDRLMIYRFDEAHGALSAHEAGSWSSRPGAGPRAAAFHPDGRSLFVVHELDNTVAMLAFDPARGAVREIDARTTLPPGWKGQSAGADVQVHPGGRYVYCSNRGHDSIAAFDIRDSSALKALGHTPTGGRIPRSFCIEPGGNWLICANQDSHDLTLFRIDKDSGKLERTGPAVAVPAPACLRLTPRDS